MAEPRDGDEIPSRRRAGRTALSVGLLGAILAATAWFVHTHRGDFAALDFSRPHLLVPLVALIPVMLVANGLQIRALVHPFGVRLAVREWYGLAAITTFYNAITPFRGGMLAKAAYLKRRHDLPLSSFTAVTAVLTLVNLFAAGLLGLAGLGGIWLAQGDASVLVAGVLAADVAVALGVLLFAPRLPAFAHPLLAPLSRVSNGWHLIRNDPAALVAASLIAIAQYGLMTAATLLSFGIMDIRIGVAKALFLASLTSISAVIGITPAGLGFIEAVAVFGGIAIGITPAESLAAAVTRRVVTTVVVLALGPIFTYGLLSRADRPGPES